MPERLHLEVVTPERKVFETEVDRVEIPGLDGEMGVLPGHAALISLLKPAGLLTYHIGEENGSIAISDGFVEISDDRVIVLADRAARPEEIDLTQALKRKEEAEKEYQKAIADPEKDVDKASVELERATMIAQIADKGR
jgi:F-type H+-transporting ATPase subunit epsilon